MSALREAAAQLVDVLERENAALLRLDLPSATALLEAKRAAVACFEQAGRSVRNDADHDPTMRAVARRLHEVSSENKCLLERAMSVQQHIMSLLAGAARKAASSNGYENAGTYARQPAHKAFALSAQA